MMKKIVLCAAAAGFLATPAMAGILVMTSPAEQTFFAGTGSTTVDLVADIPESDAVIGFGLDVLVEALEGPGNLTVDLVTIGPAFDPFVAPDGDDLAGAASPLGPAVWGDDVLLATLNVSWDGTGVWGLTPAVTAGDLTEGFPTASGFAEIDGFVGGVIVAPEPGSVLLLLVGAALIRRRR